VFAHFKQTGWGISATETIVRESTSWIWFLDWKKFVEVSLGGADRLSIVSCSKASQDWGDPKSYVLLPNRLHRFGFCWISCTFMFSKNTDREVQNRRWHKLQRLEGSCFRNYSLLTFRIPASVKIIGPSSAFRQRWEGRAGAQFTIVFEIGARLEQIQ
jgi:hypothetical protein